jgi:cytochrome c oxidase cbb3-type subunit 3
MFQNKIKSWMLFGALVFGTFIANAQDATAPVATAAPASGPGNDLMQVFLIAIIAVLGIVIFRMAQVVTLLSKQVIAKDKAKSASKIATVLIILGALTLLSSGAYAQDATSTSAEAPMTFAGLSGVNMYVLVAALLVEIFAIFYLGALINSLHRRVFEIKAEEVAETKKSWLPEWWHSLDQKVLTQAVPVEREADVLLDHDYDGIKELDNALPPWWKYGFYITIVVAFVYIIAYHVTGTGMNPTQEYVAQMEEGRLAKEKFDSENKDKVDEANIPMADAAGIEKGRAIFKENCVACHGQLGEGGAGPNLTDDYWIHKGSLNDVYASIKNGYPDKGMQSWIIKFNPKEISQIASFIKTLRGTNPAGAKAPQGDLFNEGPAQDSTAANVADSAAIVKVQ